MILIFAPALADDVLLVGASYVNRNDPEVTTEALLDEGSGSDRSVSALVHDGYRWEDHVERVATDAVWEEALVNTAWNAVFFHEFADVADQPLDSAEWQDSRDNGEILVGWVAANGADSFIWLTWGDRDGGPDYPDYEGMQDALKTGAEAYVADFTGLGYPAYIAPIGEAFRILYLAESDPFDANALWYRLYSSDEQHPSKTGSYLASCVMYAVLTGLSPEGLSGAAGVQDADLPALQAAAWQAVEDGVAAGYDYPWLLPDGPGDTGDTGGGDTGADTGPGDSGGTDSGDLDTGPDSGGLDSGSTDSGGDSGYWGDPPQTVGTGGDADGGCGCGTGGAGGFAALLGAIAAVPRRRG